MTPGDIGGWVAIALLVGFFVGLITGERSESKFTDIERKAHYHWFDRYHEFALQRERNEAAKLGKGPRGRATASANVKQKRRGKSNA